MIFFDQVKIIASLGSYAMLKFFYADESIAKNKGNQSLRQLLKLS